MAFNPLDQEHIRAMSDEGIIDLLHDLASDGSRPIAEVCRMVAPIKQEILRRLKESKKRKLCFVYFAANRNDTSLHATFEMPDDVVIDARQTGIWRHKKPEEHRQKEFLIGIGDVRYCDRGLQKPGTVGIFDLSDPMHVQNLIKLVRDQEQQFERSQDRGE